MTDLHTHILPGMDDGSKNTDTSLMMLKSEYEQGVDTVALTPHFYRDMEKPREFLLRRAAARDTLWSAMDALSAEERRAFGFYDASGSFSNLGLLLSDQAPSTVRVAIMEDGEQTVRSANLSGSIFAQLESALTAIDKRNKRFTKARYGIADAKEYRSIPTPLLCSS